MFTRVRVWGAVSLAAAIVAGGLLVGLTGSSGAQSETHEFFGDPATGTGATVGGAPAPDGSVVSVVNEIGVPVAVACTADGGAWRTEVIAEESRTVVFLLGSELASDSLLVQAGASTGVALAADGATSPVHTFFGDPAAGTGATIGGLPAPDGAVVAAENEAGEPVGVRCTMDGGAWQLAIATADADTVTLGIGTFEVSPLPIRGIAPNLETVSGPLSVEAGARTAVALAHSGAPLPFHTFSGDPATGTAAMVDGQVAPDGTVVTALDESRFPIGPVDTTVDGAWSVVIHVNEDEVDLEEIDPTEEKRVQTVTFYLDGEIASDVIPLQAGGETAVALATTPETRAVHTFSGDPADGTGATVAGDPTPDGALVTALNEVREIVGSARTRDGGAWQIAVAPKDAHAVTFYLNGLPVSPAVPVEAGALTALALSSTGAEQPPLPEHEFEGDPAYGFVPMIGGEPAPAGTAVTVRNQDGDVVGTDTVTADYGWFVLVSPVEADTVTFYLNGELASEPYPVAWQMFTFVPLVTSGVQQDALVHTFFGDPATGSAVTTGGEPASKWTTVTARNEDGRSVGHASPSDGAWRISVDSSLAETVTFYLGIEVVSEPIVVMPGAVTEIALTAEEAIAFSAGTVSRETGEWTAALSPTFTATAYHGPPLAAAPFSGDPTPVADAFVAAPGVVAAFAWDGAEFRVWRPDGPSFANTLTSVSSGDALFVLVGETASWSQGPSIITRRSVPITAGMNFVSWTGPELLPIAEAVGGIAEVLEAVFLWDAASQSYLTYRPDAPTLLNTLDALPYGAGVWVAASAGGVWAQPARDG